MLDIMKQVDPRAALAVYVAAVLAAVVGILLLASWLREPGHDGFGVYESGAAPGTPMRGLVEAPYFMIAVAFMIFDVEVALLFAWAVAAAGSGRDGLVAAAVLIGVLLAALAYLWMDGALDTGPGAHGSAPQLEGPGQ
ncbi:MAG: NADH-quinone oxidoreductase subunit A [Hyphomicrobiales bacterium]|uniref:NADH-quinone oxidoreductase subunit A n=1 Tax=Aestuariivirga sp. TaxID=2650926 RepID=UPI0035AE488C